MTPIERMILDAVKCITCGAGYGKCDCAKQLEKRRIEAEYQRLMQLSDEDLIAVCKERGVEVPE